MGSNTNVRVVLIWGKNVCKTKGVCLTNNDRKQRSKVNGEGRGGKIRVRIWWRAYCMAQINENKVEGVARKE